MQPLARLHFAHSLGESSLPQRGSPFPSSTRPASDWERHENAVPVIGRGNGVLGDWVESLPAARRADMYRRLQRASAMPDEPQADVRSRLERQTMAAGLFLMYADAHGLSPVELHALLAEPRDEALAALGVLRRRAEPSN